MSKNEEICLNLYVTGLMEAHALEREARGFMERQLDRLEDYSDVRAKLKAHLRETQAQAERLETILADFDRRPLAPSDIGGLAALTSAHAVVGDDALKNAFANYAFENYEIACYRSLVWLADQTGSKHHVHLLEQTLGEEIAMASWIENNIEKVTARHLALKSKGEMARA